MVFSLSLFLIFPLLFSDEIENKIYEALDLIKKKQNDDAFVVLLDALMMIQNRKPFGIKNIALCGVVNGYRDYLEMSRPVLKTGEVFLLYIEPEGYQIKKNESKYIIWISEDVSVKNKKGKVIFEKKDWVESKKSYYTSTIPFYITNRITDIPRGEYTYTITLKDHFRNTFYTETFEFVVE